MDIYISESELEVARAEFNKEQLEKEKKWQADGCETKIVLLEGGILHSSLLRLRADDETGDEKQGITVSCPAGQILCYYGPKQDDSADIWYLDGIRIIVDDSDR